MQSPRRSLWDGNQGSTIRINHQNNALSILHELWTFIFRNLEHVDNKNAAFLTAFVETVRIWPVQGVLKLRCWQYEDRGSQSWGVGEGGIKGAHDMRIVAPLYKVQHGDVFILDSTTSERSFEEKRSSPWSDGSLLCVCALIKRNIFWLTAHHFYVLFWEGKFPLNSGNESNLWYRSNKPRKLPALKVTLNCSTSNRGLRLSSISLNGRKKVRALMTLFPAILVSPFLRTKLISKIKGQMLSLLCVHYN